MISQGRFDQARALADRTLPSAQAALRDDPAAMARFYLAAALSHKYT